MESKCYYFVTKGYFRDKEIIKPKRPFSAKFGEDSTILRICVASSIEDCLTGIEVCDVDEAYNVYKVYPSEVYKPTKDQVPDIQWFDEYWVQEDLQLNFYCRVIPTERYWEYSKDNTEFHSKFKFKLDFSATNGVKESSVF